ncbi:MAG: nucleotidyl transferase AbiEii/AbiGii toxin family protein, partial [Christensenellales bacterium]|nr:nucleotidyl transferase AbiEii/AbiGii toxin family protein [Christensenellales bacterium]
SKIVALINRTAARDLYDISNLVKFGLFDESEEPLLRKCVMLYAVIAADTVPERFDLSGIGKLQPYKIKTDLLPVLRHGEYFDLAVAREETTRYLTSLLRPEKDELLFWQAFAEKQYRPELLFADETEALNRISAHPMALWKCERSLGTKRSEPER